MIREDDDFYYTMIDSGRVPAASSCRAQPCESAPPVKRGARGYGGLLILAMTLEVIVGAQAEVDQTMDSACELNGIVQVED